MAQTGLGNKDLANRVCTIGGGVMAKKMRPSDPAKRMGVDGNG